MAAKKSQAPAIAEGIARAHSLAAEMNSATDELNTSILAVEDALASVKLGVTATLQMSGEPESSWATYLTFGKDQQRWRLIYESGYQDGPEDEWSSTPLVNASRAVRLKAVDHIAPLIESLVKKAAEEVEVVRAKTKVLQDLNETIRASVPSGPDDIPF